MGNRNRWDNCINYCVENELEKNVFFLGTRQDIPGLLNQINAFVYSSSHDTFGIAVIEAMACGIPVIVNDWEVMMEITENGNYAEIFKSKDPKNLSHKIFEFISNGFLYNDRAKKIKPIIKEKYNITNYLQNLKILYTQS